MANFMDLLSVRGDAAADVRHNQMKSREMLQRVLSRIHEQVVAAGRGDTVTTSQIEQDGPWMIARVTFNYADQTPPAHAGVFPQNEERIAIGYQRDGNFSVEVNEDQQSGFADDDQVVSYVFAVLVRQARAKRDSVSIVR